MSFNYSNTERRKRHRQQLGITGYNFGVKTAISVPDSDFGRFERLAARHGMTRSQFYQVAGRKFADELEGEAELTVLANAALVQSGQPSEDGLFLGEAQRLLVDGTDW